MVIGKQKGNEFERKVCKKLSLWISNGERDDIFWRSAGSGSRATVSKTVRGTGDIVAIDPLGFPLIDRFVIECKNHRKLDRAKIYSFYIKLLDQCINIDLYPLLIFKESYKEIKVISIIEGFTELGIEPEEFELIKGFNVCIKNFNDITSIPWKGILKRWKV